MQRNDQRSVYPPPISCISATCLPHRHKILESVDSSPRGNQDLLSKISVGQSLQIREFQIFSSESSGIPVFARTAQQKSPSTYGTKACPANHFPNPTSVRQLAHIGRNSRWAVPSHTKFRINQRDPILVAKSLISLLVLNCTAEDLRVCSVTHDSLPQICANCFSGSDGIRASKTFQKETHKK